MKSTTDVYATKRGNLFFGQYKMYLAGRFFHLPMSGLGRNEDSDAKVNSLCRLLFRKFCFDFRKSDNSTGYETLN